jgi:hypothetical protein
MPARFIEPCLPSPADRPPSGANWIQSVAPTIDGPGATETGEQGTNALARHYWNGGAAPRQFASNMTHLAPFRRGFFLGEQNRADDRRLCRIVGACCVRGVNGRGNQPHKGSPAMTTSVREGSRFGPCYVLGESSAKPPPATSTVTARGPRSLARTCQRSTSRHARCARTITSAKRRLRQRAPRASPARLAPLTPPAAEPAQAFFLALGPRQRAGDFRCPTGLGKGERPPAKDRGHPRR